jgi:hypothetical protein
LDGPGLGALAAATGKTTTAAAGGGKKSASSKPYMSRIALKVNATLFGVGWPDLINPLADELNDAMDWERDDDLELRRFACSGFVQKPGPRSR